MPVTTAPRRMAPPMPSSMFTWYKETLEFPSVPGGFQATVTVVRLVARMRSPLGAPLTFAAYADLHCESD